MHDGFTDGDELPYMMDLYGDELPCMIDLRMELRTELRRHT